MKLEFVLDFPFSSRYQRLVYSQTSNRVIMIRRTMTKVALPGSQVLVLPKKKKKKKFNFFPPIPRSLWLNNGIVYGVVKPIL